MAFRRLGVLPFLCHVIKKRTYRPQMSRLHFVSMTLPHGNTALNSSFLQDGHLYDLQSDISIAGALYAPLIICHILFPSDIYLPSNPASKSCLSSFVPELPLSCRSSLNDSKCTASIFSFCPLALSLAPLTTVWTVSSLYLSRT